MLVQYNAGGKSNRAQAYIRLGQILGGGGGGRSPMPSGNPQSRPAYSEANTEDKKSCISPEVSRA